MKRSILSSSLLLAMIGASIILAGCAGTQPARPGQTLLSAGFLPRTPETAEQREIFARLPAYKVQSLQVKGRTYYVYKDEAKGMALVGNEAEYERYRQMAHQDRVAAGHDRAAVVDAAEARDWHGASGSDWWR